MNVIVVMKVHDDLDLSRCKANVEITGNGKKIHRNRMKIRPLPEMKEENVMYLTSKYDVDYYQDPCAVAYNDCLREMLGETE